MKLIFAHIVRNEVALAPRLVNLRYRASDKALNDMKAYQRSTGSKAKYGELYTWALMIPYIQGILMFLLALGYPFACLMVIMPGHQKTIVTWASFWLWVKLWDVGFAIVMSIERSVWAMLGNGAQITKVFDRIVQMMHFGREQALCPTTAPDPAIGGCIARVILVQHKSGNGDFDFTDRDTRIAADTDTPPEEAKQKVKSELSTFLTETLGVQPQYLPPTAGGKWSYARYRRWYKSHLEKQKVALAELPCIPSTARAHASGAEEKNIPSGKKAAKSSDS